MRKFIMGVFLAFLLPFYLFAEEKVYERTLKELDEIIARKDEYRAERERAITQLKQRLANERDGAVKYAICDELFNQYLHYQADSALHYVDEMQKYVKDVKKNYQPCRCDGRYGSI